MFRKLLVLGAVAATTSCGTPLDDTRDPGDPGSFGHKAYTLACKRLAYSEDLADMDGTTDVSGATYRQFCIDGTAPRTMNRQNVCVAERVTLVTVKSSA